MIPLGLLSIAASQLLSVSGTLYSDPESLPSLKYDYIIIGGGTAGNVVANRLTQNPKINVLVIEAGSTHQGALALEVPGLALTDTAHTSWDWNLTTIAQPQAANRQFEYQQGHVLGGSSSVNGMVYARSSKGSYDHLAKVTGDSGWSWDNMVSYFKKTEGFAPPNGQKINETFDPSVHGTKGLLGTTLPSFGFSLDQVITQSLAELPEEFPLVKDYNSGGSLGMGWTQSTIRNGSRSSSATAFLADDFLARKNLNVLIDTIASVVFSSTPNGAIDTVSFFQPTGTGKMIQAAASREIIISAGVFSTPHILLNSGIGDAAYLKSLNISVVKDLPSVGQNLTDFPVIQPAWNRTATDLISNFATGETLAQWQANRTGEFANGLTNHIGFFRFNESSPEVKSAFAQYGDPSPSPLSPHIQMSPINDGPFSVSAALVAPLSRGFVKLNASDPHGGSIVDLGFLTAPSDLILMRQAFYKIINFTSAPILKQNLGAPVGPAAAVLASDTGNGIDIEILDDYIRNNVFSMFNAVGTSAMSPKGAKYGVVDPDLRVKGVKGLRIVDASVFPYIPTASIQASVYAVAERASDLIKGTQH